MDNQTSLSPGHILGGVAGLFLGAWLGHALHLKTKAAQQADNLLGGQPGTAQNLLDTLGSAFANAITVAVAAGADHLFKTVSSSVPVPPPTSPAPPAVPSL